MPRFLKALGLIAAGFAASLASVSALAVGRFVYVDGVVNVRDAAGALRPVRTGDTVNEKDSIFVGEGRVQIRFDDGGWIALQPRTVFEVREYPRRTDGNIVLSLLKGTARAVTGVIANRDPRRYRMETATATIGIRGTSFQATYCVQSCDVPDGLYVTGGDGTIFVRNAFGEIDLSRGRTAYVPTAQTPPRETEVKPTVVIAEPTSSQLAAVGTTMTATTTGTTTGTAAVGTTTVSELRPGNFVYFEGTTGYTGPLQPVTVSSFGFGAAGSGTAAAELVGTINGVVETGTASTTGVGHGAGAAIAGPGESATVVFDAAQRLVGITATNSAGERVSVSALSPPEIAFSDGILFWGRWTNATFQFDAQVASAGSNAIGSANIGPGSYVHYIAGIPVASVPLSGIATYTFIGGSGSTSQAGTVGDGVTSGSLTANFGGNSVSTGLTISHSGIYTASGFGFLQSGNRASFTSVSGSANGIYPFTFEGFFAGAGAPAAPSRAGMTWSIGRPDPIVGTAAFRCASGC